MAEEIYWEKTDFDKAVELLKKEKVVVIKGIGGFHLAVDARREEAVLRLRTKKFRYTKPLVVMMENIRQVEEYCIATENEKQLMESDKAPIVLVKIKNGDYKIAKSVAPGLNTIGIMLPYSPLHQFLLRETGFPLVMTSGNISGEPLCIDDAEVKVRLKDIADGFLTHKRLIENPVDDSVCFFGAGQMRTVRRARGFVSAPLILKKRSHPILALGSLYKNTFCLAKDDQAFLSKHMGDLGNALTYKYYNEEIQRHMSLYDITPAYVARDMHPGYIPSIYVEELGLPVIPVQHHHAHIAAVMVEYGLENKVLGIAYDGTGMGSDGNIWGAEFLLADLKGFKRVGHIDNAPLPGGDAAIKQTFRAALGYIYPNIEHFPEYEARIGKLKVHSIFKQIRQNINTTLASSMGRLFDTVASIINLRDLVDYEGQAAMELEAIISKNDDYYEYDISEDCLFKINVNKLLRGVYEDYITGVCPGIISAKFHNTVIRFTEDLSIRLRDIYRINTVVLSGGCFQNKYLLEGLHKKLIKQGFEVFIPSLIPANDGGISLGQAIIAQNVLLEKRR